jgi:hypothetical protein
VPEQQPVPDEAVEAALAVAHEGPMSLCDMGSDTCSTRPEVRRLVEAAAPFISAPLEAENARLRRLIDRYRRPMPDGGYNWRERAHTAHVRACDAEVENARLREALSEIKRVAYIEAPPVSDEVPAKVWKLAFDALGGGDRA